MNPKHLRSIIVFSSCLFFSTALLSAQDAAPAAAPAPAAGAAPAAGGHGGHGGQDKTFFQVLKQGGVVMIPLGLTSIVMVALIIDGFMRLRNSKMAPVELVEQLRAQFRAGDYNGAYQVCRGRPTLLTNVVRAGLLMCGHGKNASESAMEEILSKEVSALNTRIYYLSLIGVITPMLGLTGTVLGMISAFSTLGTSGIGDPSALAEAIGEVLVATATGLFVAIPGFSFFYFFRNRIVSTTAYTEDIINGLFRGMPYDQLAGIPIGDEPIYAAAPHPSLLALRPGGGEMVHCPSCHQSVAFGTSVCPHCQTTLNWAA